jgi:transposase
MLLQNKKDYEFVKKIPNFLSKLKKLLKPLSEEYNLLICYEAGCCGYKIYRELTKAGYNCIVASPSCIPRDNKKVKTDKIDARKIALYLRSGILNPVNVPDESLEMDRDLIRFRYYQVQNLAKIKCQIKSFLLRKNIKYDEYCTSNNWSQKLINWLETMELAEKDRMILNKYIQHFHYQNKFVDELNQDILELSQTDKYKEQTGILRAFRGIETNTAMVILTHIPDFRSFLNPKYLSSYVGVTQREYSSAENKRQFGITKTGNRLLRNAFISAAQHYSKANKVSYALRLNRKKLHSSISCVIDRADRRCRKKHYKMIFSGKHTNKAKTAVAREIVCFVWETMMIYHNNKLKAVN